jgi:benzoyl-CoA reductase subunit B
MGIAENRLGLIERGNKVMTYEGNMGDEREFEESATLNQISIFLESLGLEKNQMI